MRLQLDLVGRTTLLAWLTLAVLAVWAAIWMSLTQPFALAQGTFSRLASMVATLALVIIGAALLRQRLDGDDTKTAHRLSHVLTGLKVFAEGCTFLVIYGVIAGTLSYLAQSHTAPLQDTVFAHFDTMIGFDWPATLSWFETKPWAAQLLAAGYASSIPLLGLALFAMAMVHDRQRAVELLALLALSAIPVVALSALYPALGACIHHDPSLHPFRSFDPMACQWYLADVLALRDGTFQTLDLTRAEGLVTFPSFHAMMGLIVIYVVRGYRWLFIPALIANGLSIVAAVPYGGHYLVDVLAGGVLTALTIAIVRATAATPATSNSQPATGLVAAE